MSLRQELLDAINLKKPARLPYTFDARNETIAILRRHLGVDEDASLAEHFGCNRFGNMWQPVGGTPYMPERTENFRSDNPDIQYDIWGVKREKQVAGDAEYFEITEYPLANAETVADVEAYDWPSPDDVVWPDMPEGLDLARWKEENDLVVNCMSYIGPFGLAWSLLGLEKIMMDAALNPAVVEATVNKIEEYTLGCLKVILEKYPNGVDLIGSGDDYGTQLGLLMSPDMLKQFFMPSLKRHYDLGKKYGVKGYHHSCGAIFDMIPLFIESGLDVLNPIQTSANGMAPGRLKEAYGKDICFHGAIDIQQTLVTGSADDVRAEVRQRIDTLGPEGYILCPSHTLQPDSPPENVIAMYDEVKIYGAW